MASIVEWMPSWLARGEKLYARVLKEMAAWRSKRRMDHSFIRHSTLCLEFALSVLVWCPDCSSCSFSSAIWYSTGVFVVVDFVGNTVL